jgi:LmbE family N-acetylglucosaminyl deacetylase
MMSTEKQTRRQMLTTSGGVLGASLLGAPLFSQERNNRQNPLKILVTGAHPDDPESGCGGTICTLKGLGHEVAVLYLTRGEAGIKGVTHDEAAEIRTAEAIEACEVMGTRPLFAGQIDGSTYINRDAYSTMTGIIEAEKPDVVFTHWPIDTHPDHRVNSNLVYNTWNRFRGDASRAFDLYYYEVMTGAQTQNFHPTHFIDITAVASIKREATLKHVSQHAAEWFSYHEKMDEFRGFQYKSNSKYAESFVMQGFSGVI